MAADLLLGHHAGLTVGSHAMAAGAAHQSTLLPQSLLMAQHHPGSAQHLVVARQDPAASMLSSHAGLVGHHGLAPASGLAVVPGLTAHDYQHGLGGQQSAMARGEVRGGHGHGEVHAASAGLHQQQQQQGSQLGSWPSDHQVQQTSQHDPTDRLQHKYARP